ncbi:hypothetical protein [Streptomyces mirabilis]|jgi:hypothetical protein|uniref:Uncharacterized protein n=1 Tax=Streptomyces mirabilis TaxID=68239 RepID=A0A1I2MCJ1_9ACTN|nr:hypothetical protein [Streptomyces mirabilis]SFF89173.1 hypothetical protein SAMN02787118_11370 [Streptomyces mirabilis]
MTELDTGEHAEVDCQAPGPLAGAYGATQGSGATQKHVHSVIRTTATTTEGSSFDSTI